MRWSLTSRMPRRRRRRVKSIEARQYRPFLEPLEERVLLSGDGIGDTLVGAAPILLAPAGQAAISSLIDNNTDVDMFVVNLNAGDQLVADIDAESIGSALDSYLRVFDAAGDQVAFNDDSDGLDSGLTFLAPAAGAYFVGVSAFPNSSYDPNVADSGFNGSTGFYDLNLQRIINALPGVVFASTDGPVAILDNATVLSTVAVSESFTLADVDVELDITHTWDADLDVFLISPTGTRVQLFTDVGGSGNNFTATVLDDEAGTAITAGAAPFAGSFRPEGTLGVLDGADALGVWTLEISDDTGSDQGTLNGWSLRFDRAEAIVYAGPDVPLIVPNLKTIESRLTIHDSFAIADLDVRLSIDHTYDSDMEVYLISPAGTRVLLLSDVGADGDNFTNTVLDDEAAGSIVSGLAPFTGSFRPEGTLSAFDGEDIAGEWILEVSDDFYEDVGTLLNWALIVDPAVDYSSGVVNQPIPDAGTIVSAFNITDDFDISDVDVSIDLTHTLAGDLSVYLTSPTGTEVELFSNLGGGGADFAHTILDDEAATAIVAGSAPYTGRYRPQSPLDAFDGENVQGVWSLRIEDNAGGNSGNLLGWSLSFGVAPYTELAALSFAVPGPVSQWGADLPVQYRIGNQGRLGAGPTEAEVYISADSIIDSTDVLLGTITLPALGPGQSVDGTISLSMPATPPAGFTIPDDVYIGLFVDPQNAVVEVDESNNRNVGLGVDLAQLRIVPTQEVEANDDKTTTNEIGPNGFLDGTITSAGDRDFFKLTVTKPGYLTIGATATGASALDSRLALHSVDSLLLIDGMRIGGGGLLITSDDQAAGNPDPLIQQYVLPGTYFIEVSSAGSGASASGAYQATTQFVVDPLDQFDFETYLPSRLLVGQDPRAVVAGDFNRDGILDLATANFGDGTVSVLIGIGDSTFEPKIDYALPAGFLPEHLALFNFNDDRRTDLAALDITTGTVVVLTGVGDGTFLDDAQALPTFAVADPLVAPLFSFLVPTEPSLFDPIDIPDDQTTLSLPLNVTESLIIEDVDVYLELDHSWDEDLDVFLVAPEGTRVELFTDVGGDTDDFITVVDDQAPVAIGSGAGPFIGRYRPEGALADFNGLNAEGIWTLEITDDTPGESGSVYSWTLLFNSLLPFTNTQTGLPGDFNRNGQTDVIVLDSLDRSTAPFYGDRLKLFVGVPSQVDAFVDTQTSTDPFFRFLGTQLYPPDGLVPTSEFLNQDIQLSGADRFYSNPTRSTPSFADFNGDNVEDVVVISRSGDILVRYGLDQGLFAPPVRVNGGPADPGARAIAVVQGAGAPMIAALDVGSASNTLALYEFDPATGAWQRSQSYDTGFLPLRLAVGDLDKDGHDDIVVGNALLGSVSIYLALPDGTFLPQSQRIKTGLSISDIVLVDANQDAYLDIVIANLGSGDVGILRNLGLPPGSVGFDEELRFRADEVSAGPYLLTEAVSNVANNVIERDLGIVNAFPAQFFVYSEKDTQGVAAHDFTGDGLVDLVAINRESQTFDLLVGKGTGSFADPRLFALNAAPLVVRGGDFDGVNGVDLAILDDAGAIHVYLNDGAGNFSSSATIAAGNSPTGMSIADVNGDAVPDLVVGNVFGDILLILGRGDGSFREFSRVGQSVPFVVTDLDGDNVVDVVLASETDDRILGQNRLAGTTSFSPDDFNQKGGDLIGPAAVALNDLDQDGFEDYIVANTGSNNILVYRGVAPGEFDPVPLSFFAGTNPAALLVQDVDNDANGLLDVLVANQGSNDISVLFGQFSPGGDWSLVQGPRLDSGGLGPNNIALVQQTPDNILDLVVTNGQSGEMTVLPGLGAGFFNDVNPESLVFSLPIAQTLTPAPNLGYVVTQSGSIFQFDPSLPFAQQQQLQPVFDSAPGRLVTALAVDPGGSLIAGRSDGTVSVLNSAGAGVFVESFFFAGTQLARPSALAVVGDEIYLTYEGDSVPVVLEMTEPDPTLPNPGFFTGGIPLIGDLLGDPVFVEATSLEAIDQAQLSLVAAILTSSGLSTPDELDTDDADSGFVVGLDLRAGLLGSLLITEAEIEGGAEEEPIDEELVKEGPLREEKWIQLVIGVQSALDRLMELIEARFAAEPDADGEASGGGPVATLVNDLLDLVLGQPNEMADGAGLLDLNLFGLLGKSAPADMLPGTGELLVPPQQPAVAAGTQEESNVPIAPTERAELEPQFVAAAAPVADRDDHFWGWTGLALGSAGIAFTSWWGFARRRRGRKRPAVQ